VFVCVCESVLVCMKYLCVCVCGHGGERVIVRDGGSPWVHC
jgi:hypothetical protein